MFDRQTLYRTICWLNQIFLVTKKDFILSFIIATFITITITATCSLLSAVVFNHSLGIIAIMITCVVTFFIVLFSACSVAQSEKINLVHIVITLFLLGLGFTFGIAFSFNKIHELEHYIVTVEYKHMVQTGQLRDFCERRFIDRCFPSFGQENPNVDDKQGIE